MEPSTHLGRGVLNAVVCLPALVQAFESAGVLHQGSDTWWVLIRWVSGALYTSESDWAQPWCNLAPTFLTRAFSTSAKAATASSLLVVSAKGSASAGAAAAANSRIAVNTSELRMVARLTGD